MRGSDEQITIDIDGHEYSIADLRKLIAIATELAHMAEWELVPLGPGLQSRAFTLVGKSKR